MSGIGAPGVSMVSFDDTFQQLWGIDLGSLGGDLDIPEQDVEVPGLGDVKLSFEDGNAAYKVTNGNGETESIPVQDFMDLVIKAMHGDEAAITRLRELGYDLNLIQKNLATGGAISPNDPDMGLNPVVYNDPEHGWTVLAQGMRVSGFDSEQEARSFDIAKWMNSYHNTEYGGDIQAAADNGVNVDVNWGDHWSLDESYQNPDNPNLKRYVDSETGQEVFIDAQMHQPAPAPGPIEDPINDTIPDYIPIVGWLDDIFGF